MHYHIICTISDKKTTIERVTNLEIGGIFCNRVLIICKGTSNLIVYQVTNYIMFNKNEKLIHYKTFIKLVRSITKPMVINIMDI